MSLKTTSGLEALSTKSGIWSDFSHQVPTMAIVTAFACTFIVTYVTLVTLVRTSYFLHGLIEYFYIK